MSAVQQNITIEQGATFQLELIWKNPDTTPINLTGYTARMQVRKKHTDSTKILDLTTQNGKIVLTPLQGKINVTVPAADTEDITIKSGVYDLELESSTGIVTRLIEGCVTVTPEVTRA